jgi:hypothetical protein
VAAQGRAGDHPGHEAAEQKVQVQVPSDADQPELIVPDN